MIYWLTVAPLLYLLTALAFDYLIVRVTGRDGRDISRLAFTLMWPITLSVGVVVSPFIIAREAFKE